jgi:hypothetical protein
MMQAVSWRAKGAGRADVGEVFAQGEGASGESARAGDGLRSGWGTMGAATGLQGAAWILVETRTSRSPVSMSSRQPTALTTLRNLNYPALRLVVVLGPSDCGLPWSRAILLDLPQLDA